LADFVYDSYELLTMIARTRSNNHSVETGCFGVNSLIRQSCYKLL